MVVFTFVELGALDLGLAERPPAGSLLRMFAVTRETERKTCVRIVYGTAEAAPVYIRLRISDVLAWGAMDNCGQSNK